MPSDDIQAVRTAQDTSNWMIDISKKRVFGGVDLQLSVETELNSKVDSLLAIAYETRDFHVAELFALERKHRRDVLLVELQKLILGDIRAKVAADYTDLDDVKSILRDRGFTEEVGRYVKNCEAPSGLNTIPSDLAFVYKSSSLLVDVK